MTASVVLAAGEWSPREAAAYVIESYAKSVLAVIETGQRLEEAKGRLPHGGWLPFVELLPFSERTAQRLMDIEVSRQMCDVWGELYVLTLREWLDGQ